MVSERCVRNRHDFSARVLLSIWLFRPGRSMEPELPQTAPPSTAQYVFRNERGLRAGWRILTFLGIFLAILIFLLAAAGIVVAIKGGPKTPESALTSPPFLLLNELVPFIAVVLAGFVMSRIERRSMATYGLPLNKSAIPQFVTGYLLWGFLPLTLLLLLMRTLGVFYFGSVGLHPLEALRWAGLWGAVFLSVGLFEEYLARGYLLVTLAEGIGFWPAALIMSALFGLAHLRNGGETRIGIVDAALFGFFGAITFRMTGSLWLAVGAHAGWDWGQSYFFGVGNSGIQVPGHLFNPHSHGPVWLSGGTVGPEGSVLSSLLLAAMTAVFVALYNPRGEAADIRTTRSNQTAPPVS